MDTRRRLGRPDCNIVLCCRANCSQNPSIHIFSPRHTNRSEFRVLELAIMLLHPTRTRRVRRHAAPPPAPHRTRTLQSGSTRTCRPGRTCRTRMPLPCPPPLRRPAALPPSRRCRQARSRLHAADGADQQCAHVRACGPRDHRWPVPRPALSTQPRTIRSPTSSSVASDPRVAGAHAWLSGAAHGDSPARPARKPR